MSSIVMTLWFVKILADCKINNIPAAFPPLFCYHSWPFFDSLLSLPII